MGVTEDGAHRPWAQGLKSKGFFLSSFLRLPLLASIHKAARSKGLGFRVLGFQGLGFRSLERLLHAQLGATLRTEAFLTTRAQRNPSRKLSTTTGLLIVALVVALIKNPCLILYIYIYIYIYI